MQHLIYARVILESGDLNAIAARVAEPFAEFVSFFREWKSQLKEPSRHNR